MGKKGGWITALKKAFTTSPRDKPTNLVAQYSQQQQHRGSGARDKKRWGFGRSRQHAEPAPAGALINIPLYREPSSIEKILVDAEMDRQCYGRAQYQITPAKPATVTAATPSTAAASLPAPALPLPPARERPRQRDVDDDKPAVVLPLPPSSPPPLIRRFDQDREQQQRLQQMQQHTRAETEWRQPRHAARAARAARPRRAVPPDRARAAAVAIQSAFRGYMARRNYRSLRGLIRLQGVVRGPSVRRQTAHAMRCMQMLVRVQSQVRASRVEAMERRNGHHRAAMLRDAARRAGSQDGGIWDDSLLSRDEMDARTKRKVEAVIKRERALAYAYSHQLLKATPMAAHAILADLQSGRSPWWWTPIERRHETEAAVVLPRRQHAEHVGRQAALAVSHRETAVTAVTATATPARSVASSYSTAKPRATRPAKVASSYGGGSIRDDESLTSCPAFGGVPNYMTPTLSASARARARAQMLKKQLEKQQQAAQEKPRFSFGLGQSIGSWAKSPFWKGAGGGSVQPSISSRVGTPAASVAGGRHRPTRSVSELSVDSAVSMPAGLGRRPYK
ncbi:protein IQ-DOMAIN 14 isoform X2 [Oryza brachyantha]|uniref:protein IQ-DOMAIN 14 isoform X2 n=1 Tax=Oryza brachyantha TaxID=4533 RepID=UPI001ADAEFAB|nr:protein IQ-DOMAIN 14 isoform X2 [Oryza brachyantha]